MKNIFVTIFSMLLLSSCFNSSSLKTHSFAGAKLVATAKVSNLVTEIEALESSNTMSINLNSNQNVKIGKALNISLTPSENGYLKIIIVNPKGEKDLVIQNSLHNGYIKANHKFSTTNNKFSLRAFNPQGLHYVITIFSQKNSYINTKNLLSKLKDISKGKYLKHNISIYPMRVY